MKQTTGNLKSAAKDVKETTAAVKEISTSNKTTEPENPKEKGGVFKKIFKKKNKE